MSASFNAGAFWMMKGRVVGNDSLTLWRMGKSLSPALTSAGEDRAMPWMMMATANRHNVTWLPHITYIFFGTGWGLSVWRVPYDTWTHCLCENPVIIANSVLVVQNTVKWGRDKAGRKYWYFWLYHIASYMLKYLVSRNKLVPTRTEPTSTNLCQHKPQMPGDTKYNIFWKSLSITNCIWISTNYLPRFQLNLCRTHRDMGKLVMRIKKCPKQQFFDLRLWYCN
jgi:hypothetical protein